MMKQAAIYGLPGKLGNGFTRFLSIMLMAGKIYCIENQCILITDSSKRERWSREG
jgi:hypothetical protein